MVTIEDNGVVGGCGARLAQELRLAEVDTPLREPAVTIFVNTREFLWDEKEITYEQVYNLAFPNEPLNEGDVARIEYSRGQNGGGAGTLQPGGTVNVKVNMVFDLYVTVRS